MPAAVTPRQAAAELARLLAVALQRRQGSAAPASHVDAGGRMRELIATLSADSAALEGFFASLGRELKSRGLRMPAPEQLSVPAEVLPLLATLDAALAPATDGEAGELDHEALAQRLNEQLHALLGEGPREAGERVLAARIRARAGTRVAAAMRKRGLVPLRDAPDGDSFWDLVEAARHDHAGFVERLGQLPRERLTAFYWEHVAAVMALRRAGLDIRSRAEAAQSDSVDLAAQVVALGYEFHAAAVAEPARVALDSAAARVDLAADAARIFSERFGEPLAPGL